MRRNRRPWRWLENNLPAPRRLIKNLEPPGPKTQKPDAKLTRRHASLSCSVMSLSNMTRQLGQVSATHRKLSGFEGAASLGRGDQPRNRLCRKEGRQRLCRSSFTSTAPKARTNLRCLVGPLLDLCQARLLDFYRTTPQPKCFQASSTVITQVPHNLHRSET